MNKQQGHRSQKKANYYTRQFDRTAANKARRATKAKRKRPLKPGAVERFAKRAKAIRDLRTARRVAEREAQRIAQQKRERAMAELREA